MENLSKVFQKQTKKTHMERLEFHNSIQYWVFTTTYSCRKVLGKMPEVI